MDDMEWLRANAPDGSEADPTMAWLRKNAPAQGADANLGGTLQFGPLDTGIPIPASLEAGLVGAGKTLTNLGRGIVNPTNNAATDAKVAEENRLYQPLAQAHPMATTAGEIAPYMVTANPLAMAGMSALEYGTPAERAERAGLAYAGGKVGQGIGRLFGPKSMAAVPTGANDFFDYAANVGNKWGIPLRAAQTTDSKPIQILDSVAANLPISSGVIAKAKDASFQGFNRAVANTFGSDATKITPELLGQSQTNVGREIGRIADRSTMVADTPFAQDFAKASARINDELVGDDAKLAAKWFDNVQAKIGPDGTMSGQLYKELRAKIGAAAKNQGGTVANVLGDLKSALTNAMDRSIAPEDFATWQKLNRQYFNVKQVGNAARATPGQLSPSQLLTEVNKAQPSSRFGAGNDLAELARWAKPVLGDQIPNSGTAQRLFYQKMLTNPLTTLGSAGGALYGADQFGINPMDASAGLLFPYLASRGMAGKPASEFTRKLLQRSGGLLGLELAPQ